MGTNYYLLDINNPNKKLHIGKKSAGWLFSVHVYDNKIKEPPIQSWEDWKLWITNHKCNFEIRNEYGQKFSELEFFDIVQNPPVRKKLQKVPYGYRSWIEFHRINQSEIGPLNYLRAKFSSEFKKLKYGYVKNDHCTGHGEFWDLIKGEYF